MKIEAVTVFSQNITIVYEAIDLQSIDTRQLKTLVPNVKPALVDMPGMLVAAYLPMPLVIQFGDRRVRVIWQQESQSVGNAPLWDLASKCHSLVSQHPVSAYGFNYDLRAKVDNTNNSLGILSALHVDLNALNALVEGEVLFVPRLQFHHGDGRYDLIFEIADEQHVIVHLNAHFDRQIIPDLEALKASFIEQFQYFENVWPRLLGVIE